MIHDESPAALREYERAELELAGILRALAVQRAGTRGSAHAELGRNEICGVGSRCPEGELQHSVRATASVR